MKLKHQFRNQIVEREVHESIPLGFLLSNKIGGILFFDAKKDHTQFYARVDGATVKLLHDINFEGKIRGISNKVHSLAISRDLHDHCFFVPHYMNAILMTFTQDSPFEFVFDLKDIDKQHVFDKHSLDKHSVYEKDGRVIVKSSSQDGHQLYTAIQGSKLFYEVRKNTALFTMDVMSRKVSVAVAGSEDKAIAEANYLFENEQKIRSIQEKYLSSGAEFRDPETALAYACVLNGIDHMLLPDQSKEDSVMPLPVLSDLTGHHVSIAMHAMLLENEFGIAKKTLLSEIDIQHENLEQGKSGFEEAAWPVMMTGRLMNQLCARKKLYTYFSPDEVKKFAEKIARLTNLTKEKHTKNGFIFADDDRNKLEHQALMLSVYDLAFALTKDPTYSDAEARLKSKVQKMMHEMLLSVKEGKLDVHDVISFFMTAYIYPLLWGKEAWTSLFDTLLDKMHNNFGVLKSKMVEDRQTTLDLELFGLASMAATVLYRVDPEHYELQVNQLMKMTINDALYYGIIGRPSSSFDHDVNPETDTVIQNRHLLNNALFLEMIRECA